MKKYLYKTVITGLALLCLGTVASGCYSISSWCKRNFQGEDPIDRDAYAKYWNGPRVGAGMKLEIMITAASAGAKSMSVLVDQKGKITLPYLLQEPIDCDGMTLEELKAKLLEEYSAYIRQPQITVTFGAFDGQGVSPWGTVMVMGEIGSPGPVNVPSTKDLTIMRVLQLAGGTKTYADKTAIEVTRCDKDGKLSRIYVDLRDIGQGGRVDKDIPIHAGDVVYVPETWY